MNLSLGCLKTNTVCASSSRTVKTWVSRKGEGSVKNSVDLGSIPALFISCVILEQRLYLSELRVYVCERGAIIPTSMGNNFIRVK